MGSNAKHQALLIQITIDSYRIDSRFRGNDEATLHGNSRKHGGKLITRPQYDRLCC